MPQNEIDKLLLEFKIHDANQQWQEKIVPNLHTLHLNPDLKPDNLLKTITQRIKARIQARNKQE